MPWFSAPENPGQGVTNYGNGATGSANKWGQHWSSVGPNTRYPDNFITVTDYNEQMAQTRDICAHYHPLIGPYNGKDTAVLEYHLLLMKLSGIDGVLIDWYGKAGNGVNDAAPLLDNSNALIKQMSNVGLKYGLIMEDAGWKSLTAATDNGNYAINNYFNTDQYIKLSDLRGTQATNANAPLLGVFGPQKFKTTGQWNTILNGNTGAFLPLYNQSSQIGADAAGEFAWPYPQAVLNGASDAWYTNLKSYYNDQAAWKNIVLGAAYPGFCDFYGTNGASTLGIIPRTYGTVSTLSSTLSLYSQYQSAMDGLQLATWNDFSEGTIIEPTVEEGFRHLGTIQQFTGVPYTEKDLQQVYRFFTLRKKFSGNATKQLILDQVFRFFTMLQIDDAIALMNSIDNINAPRITVSSSGTPAEGGTNGSFTIKATPVSSPVTIHFLISGTRLTSSYVASPLLTGSVVLTPTDTSITFIITPTDDSLVNPNQTINLQILTDTAYNINGTGLASLTVIDNEIPPCEGPIAVYTSTAPKIDGAADSTWLKAPVNLITQTISGTIQTGSSWQAMYDSVNLYVMVHIKDTNLSNIGTSVWDQDGVEIYIAGNNNKAGTYTAYDHQYRFNWNVLPFSTDNITGTTGKTTGIIYAIPTTQTGYTLEVSFPWETIGGTPPYNWKAIGFDININDQHNYVGQRESTAGWNGTNSDNYRNTSSFGTVPLVICKSDMVVPSPEFSNIANISGKEYQPFSFAIIASNSPDSFTSATLPEGLQLNTQTGIISGIPLTWGFFSVNISAENIAGTTNMNLTINIDSTPAVQFAGITAYRSGGSRVSIDWTVNKEIAIAQYEVQRSTDSTHFITLNTITEVGNNNTDGVRYHSDDLLPLAGGIYYRIKATSNNPYDREYFSEIVKVNKSNEAYAYPNPTHGNNIYIPFPAGTSTIYFLRITDMQGKTVLKKSISIPAEGVIYNLQLPSYLSNGIYQIEIIGKNNAKISHNFLLDK